MEDTNQNSETSVSDAETALLAQCAAVEIIIAQVKNSKISAPAQLMRDLDNALHETPLILRNEKVAQNIADFLDEVVSSQQYSLMCETWARKIRKEIPGCPTASSPASPQA